MIGIYENQIAMTEDISEEKIGNKCDNGEESYTIMK